MTPEQFAFVLRAAIAFRAVDERGLNYDGRDLFATDAINKGIALLQAAEQLRKQYGLPLSAYEAIGDTPIVATRARVVRSEEPREDD